MVRLGDVCELKAGDFTPASEIHAEKEPGYYPCFGGNGLRGYIDRYTHEGEFSLIGRQGALCGNVQFAQGKFYATEHAVVTKPKIEIYSHWLYYMLRSLNLNKLSVGAAQPGITVEKLNHVEIPLPPLEEQHRVAAIIKCQLAAAEKAKRLAEEQLAAAEALKNAYLRETFKDGDWDEVRLGDVCDFIGGSQPPKSTFIYNPQNGYIRLVQIQDFRRNDAAVYVPVELASRFFEKDDVMIGRYGPPVFQILRGLEGAYNVALMKAVPKNTDILSKDFLYYLLQGERIQNEIIEQSQRSAGQSGVDKDFLERRVVKLPPIDTQRRKITVLTEKLYSAEKTKAALKAQLLEIMALPAAILRKAFNG